MSGYFKRLYQRFLKIRGSKREISLGLALGIFIGFSPTMGIQIAVAVFIASLLKWSKIAAALGVQITNPLTAPFIYSFTYYLGAKILGLEKPFQLAGLRSLDALVEMVRQAPRIIAALTLGGVLVGLPLSLAAYLIVFRLLNRFQEPLKAGFQNRTARIRERVNQRKAKRKKKKKKF